MSSFLVLESPLGFYIFSDPQMILVESNFNSDPNVLRTLQKKASYLFPDFEIAAKIKYSIDQEYTLPNELSDFFIAFSKHYLKQATNAKWYFITQILCQLVSEKFNFMCFCLPASNQRLLYEFLPELTETSKEEIDDANRNIALEISMRKIENSIDAGEEGDQNENKKYVEDFIFADSDS